MATECERIIKIINAVKKRECLWNVNSGEYAKRDKLEKAWREVAEEVGKTEVFCREKWRNVRTGFLRSLQSNFRIIPSDESNNEFQTVRRKRFYLYEQMKFILPAADTLEQTRKRRKMPHGEFIKSDDYTDYFDGTMQDYTMIGKFEARGRYCEVETEREELEEENGHSNYEHLLKEIEETVTPKTKKTSKKNVAANSRDVQEQQQEESLDNTKESRDSLENLTKTIVEDTLTLAQKDKESVQHMVSMTADYDERSEAQLLDFFRGNMGDILTLSKRKQRLFKRRMLELIEALHETEDE